MCSSDLNTDLTNTSSHLKRVSDQSDRTGRGLSDSLGRSSRAVSRLNDSLGRTATALDVLGVRGGGSLRSITQLAGGSKLAIAGLGAAAGVAATALTIGIGARGVRAAANLETAMANVASISSEVAGNMAGVTKEIRQLARDANADPRLLSAGLYQTISAGITDTGDAMAFLRQATDSARAGLTDISTTVNVLSSILAAYGDDVSEVESVSDKLFKTVDVGKTTFAELASSIGSVAPIAANTGVSQIGRAHV